MKQMEDKQMEQTKIYVAKVFDGKNARSSKYTLVDVRELEKLIESKAKVDNFIVTACRFMGYTALVVAGIVFGVILL